MVFPGLGQAWGQEVGLCRGREQGSEVELVLLVVQFPGSDQLGNMGTANTETEKTNMKFY